MKNNWYKVFLPLEDCRKGGGRWIGKEVCVQAESVKEAEEIATRVFVPKGFELDDFPDATEISLDKLAEFRLNQRSV